MAKLLNPQLLKQNIDAAAQYDLNSKKVFGAAYYVCQEGTLTLERCYGTVAPHGEEPVTNTTLFRLASMTKPITAVAALILVDRGLLGLDDPVEQYLPEFAGIHIIDAEGRDLGLPQIKPTLRHILSHCSGIGSTPEKTADARPEDKADVDSYVRYMRKVGLDFEPASMQKYSGMGAFDVLTKIIEQVAGVDYQTFLQQEIFTPCGMVDTTFTPNGEQAARMVTMHQRKEGENAAFSMPKGCVFEDFPVTHYLGGAGLVSTLRDYCRFCERLLHEGEGLVSAETFRQLCTPQIYKKEDESWGLGVRVITNDKPSGLTKNCFGWSGAYGSHFWIDPERRIYAVYMKNSKVDGGAGNESAVNFEKAVYHSFYR